MLHKEKMRKVKDIWNDEKLRSGGFYELAIEVSDNKDKTKIQDLTQKLFELDFVKGPFNSDFENLELDLEYFENLGYIEIEEKQIPFKTFNISEEAEGGSNWLDICIYTAIYEEVLGKEYQTWATEGKWHREFDELLIRILKELNSAQKVRVGAIGFEVSGMYYLQTLKEKELDENDVSHTKFFVNKGEELKGKNWNLVFELV